MTKRTAVLFALTFSTGIAAGAVLFHDSDRHDHAGLTDAAEIRPDTAVPGDTVDVEPVNIDGRDGRHRDVPAVHHERRNERDDVILPGDAIRPDGPLPRHLAAAGAWLTGRSADDIAATVAKIADHEGTSAREAFHMAMRQAGFSRVDVRHAISHIKQGDARRPIPMPSDDHASTPVDPIVEPTPEETGKGNGVPAEQAEQLRAALADNVTETAFADLAEKLGLTVRVVRLDGEQLAATKDYSPRRVNVEVAAGLVVAIVSFG